MDTLAGMEKPKDGEGANSGVGSVSALGKKVREEGIGVEKGTWEVAWQDRTVYSNFVRPYSDITLRSSGQGVCYSVVFIYTGGADSCDLENQCHWLESLPILDHPTKEYDGNHPSSDTQDNSCHPKICPDDRLNSAALCCRNF